MMKLARKAVADVTQRRWRRLAFLLVLPATALLARLQDAAPNNGTAPTMFNDVAAVVYEHDALYGGICRKMTRLAVALPFGEERGHNACLVLSMTSINATGNHDLDFGGPSPYLYFTPSVLVGAEQPDEWSAEPGDKVLGV